MGQSKQTSRTRRVVILALPGALLISLGCADSRRAPPEPAQAEYVYASWPDPLAGMAHGTAQIAAVCARDGDDAVRDAFCTDPAPDITSLAQLSAALRVDSASLTGLKAISDGVFTDIAITGHSTSLSARSVSAINPRAIAFRTELVGASVLALAFTRGEQFAEVIARDRKSQALNFYVVGFRQACNAGSCTPGDLLTPAIESGWTELSLYDAHDVKNSVLDCAPCHQAGGPDTRSSLLMQEFNNPWTHWFWRQSDGGRALLDDYFAAKGDEPLAGMSATQIEAVDPNMLTSVVAVVSPGTPINFDSVRIEAEIAESAAAEGGSQPVDNSITGASATWREAYERAKRGEQISLPYPNVKVTDPDKLARLTAAYRAYRAGELPPEQLPDLRDIYPDDPARQAELGVATEPGLDGRAVLMQACAQCHNARLDQQISRARFRADLQGMSRAERELAIARLSLPPENPLAMPPARLKVLSAEARARAMEVLRVP